MAAPKKKSRRVASTQPPDAFMEKLKTFVRTRGVDFLRDPNITSVGIGYKREDGKPTQQISIQFTVGQKARPEALDEMGTTLIPASFVIDDVEVPTDVLQRSYEPAYKIVAESVTNPRKTRINPIVPGASVAHRQESAGTIGCIVYDQHAGTPYILSNWHVLHGPLGHVGDDIMQPGPHDDNRVEQNRLGKLVRSHLGAAGDCAIATIEDRTFKPDILELDVQVEQLGEAELGDKVIKSGRTTGVTHGIVTRVHTVVRVDYEGDVDEQDIGGFEIGPDDNHLPDNGEISMGGDSGSAWMFKSANGRPTRIMAGLHFAGESSGDPNEHAMACYARSVFEKLEVSPTPPAVPVDHAEAVSRRGYDRDFLGPGVAVPTLTAAGMQKAFKRSGSEVIPYTHFSLALSEKRRFAIWVAWNIDGGRLRKVSRKGIPFVLDSTIPAQFQVDDTLYAGNRLDRGHIARRADLCWGSDREARQANRDSFFFTNITPQMDDFNQSSEGGLWGRLEDAVFADVDVENLRVSVFGGPVFRDDDREFRGVKIPREFYKVLAYVENGNLRAKAFLLTQRLDALELLDLDDFRVFQVSLAEVEQRCDCRFPDALKAADGFAEFLANRPEAAEDRKPLESLDQIRW
jgi:endonuclease G